MYIGPCTDVLVPPQISTVLGGRGSVMGLEEFSTYVVTVTPHGGRQSSNIIFSTLAAGTYIYIYVVTY